MRGRKTNGRARTLSVLGGLMLFIAMSAILGNIVWTQVYIVDPAGIAEPPDGVLVIGPQKATADTGKIGLNVGPTTYPLASSDVAGVIAKGYNQSNWNNALGVNSGSVSNAVDSTGASTGVSFSWTGASETFNNASTPDRKLTGNFVQQGGGGPATFIISNIPFSQYDVVLYYNAFSTNNNDSTVNLDYGNNGSTDQTVYVSDQDTDLSIDGNDYVEWISSTGPTGAPAGANYGVVLGLTATSLKITVVDDSDPHNSLAGIQLISPSSLGPTSTPTITNTPGGPTDTPSYTRTITNTPTNTPTRTPTNTSGPTNTPGAPPAGGLDDITFFVVTDTHYGVGQDAANQAIVDKMNAIPGTAYPPAIGGNVAVPRGVFAIGDMTESAQQAQWDTFVSDFGLNGEGRLDYPVYEAFGNHDYGSAVVKNAMITRNLSRPSVKHIASNGLHYSWDWDNVHFISLNLFPGNTDTGDLDMGDPMYALEFAEHDLTEQVGSSGRPVVIIHHYGLDSWGCSSFAQSWRDLYGPLLADYNVVGIFSGHTHGKVYTLWSGIDTYITGAAQPVSSTQGFAAVHLTRTGMSIAVRTHSDTWNTVWQKSVSFPGYPASMKKGPYLIYPKDNTKMDVLWQLSATGGCKIEWGQTASCELGSAATTPYGSDYQHKYTITNLTPGTKYYYRVTVDGQSGLSTGSFSAAPAANAVNLKLFAYGDTRSQATVHDQVCDRMLTKIEADANYQTIALHSGDWSSDNVENMWTNEYFARASTNALQFQSMVPVMGAWGNHEGAGTMLEKYLPFPYQVSGDYYYSFDYGPLHVSVVDVSIGFGSGTTQYNWLVSDLQNANKPWKFLVLHYPGWGAGTHANNTTVQNDIQPLLETYDVDMLIAGHNHNYVRAEVNGVKHLTLGGGAAPLYAVDSGYPNVVVCSSNYHNAEINITDYVMTCNVVKPDGTSIDYFTIEHAQDLTPPSPNPATFASAPDGTGPTVVSMTSTTGSDIHPPVEYYFDETSGNPGGSDSGWVTNPSYIDTGLTPNTTYTYTVKMRDSLLNTGTASAPKNATTDPPDSTPPSPNPATFAVDPWAIADTQVSMTSTTGSDTSTPIEYYFDETTGNPGGSDSGWITNTTYVDSGLSPLTQYTYTVKMRDSALNVGGVSAAKSVTTPNVNPPVVSLDATGLPLGSLTSWTNTGTLGGTFGNDSTTPVVADLAGYRAVTFDGTDHMLSSVNAPASIGGTNPFSVAVWGYNPAVAANEQLVSWADRYYNVSGSAEYGAFGWGTNTGEGAAYYRYGIDLPYSGAPSASTWHHITVTFQGGATGTMTVYVDGTFNNSIAMESMMGMYNYPICLGAMKWTGNVPEWHLPFSGSLAVVQVYSYELSSAQVAGLASIPPGGGSGPTNTPAATSTPTSTPTRTPTNTPTSTPTNTATPAPTRTPQYSTYTFSGINQANTNYNAYACDVDVFPFAGSTGNRNSMVEATDAQYTSIATQDSSRWTTADPGSSDEVFLWVEMKVNETPSDITNIELTYVGYTGGTSATTYYMYVKDKAVSWEQNAAWIQLGTSQSFPAGSDSTMTRSVTSNFAQYIDASSKLTFGVSETRSSEVMYINFLRMVVAH